MSFELITNDHLSKIITILDNTQNEINMVSPFITVWKPWFSYISLLLHHVFICAVSNGRSKKSEA